MDGTAGGTLLIIVILVMIFMLIGEPDLWDKLYQISHQWADAQLVQ